MQGGWLVFKSPGLRKQAFFHGRTGTAFFLQMFPGIFFMWYVGSCVVRAQKYSSGRLKFYWAWRAPWHHESKKRTFKHLIPDVLWRIHEIAWSQQTAPNKNSTLTPRTNRAVFWSAVPPASWLERSGFSCRKNRLGCQVCVMRLGELLVNKSIIFHVAMWLYMYTYKSINDYYDNYYDYCFGQRGIWIPKGCCFFHSKYVNKKCLSWKHEFQFGQAESLETKKGAWVL